MLSWKYKKLIAAFFIVSAKSSLFDIIIMYVIIYLIYVISVGFNLNPKVNIVVLYKLIDDY